MTDNFLNLELEFFKFSPRSYLTTCDTYSLNSSNCPATSLSSTYARMNHAVKGYVFTKLDKFC